MRTVKSHLIARLLFLTASTCGLALTACQDVADPDAPATTPEMCDQGPCLEAQYADPSADDDEDDSVVTEDQAWQGRFLEHANDDRPDFEDPDADPELAEVLGGADPALPTVLAGDECKFESTPKPYGGAQWGSARVELWSDDDETCFYTRVSNTSSTRLCAWVKHPFAGNVGKKCKIDTQVFSHKVLAFGAPWDTLEAWGEVGPAHIPIWFAW